MKYIELGKNFFIYMPVVLFGSKVSRKANFKADADAHGPTPARPASQQPV